MCKNKEQEAQRDDIKWRYPEDLIEEMKKKGYSITNAGFFDGQEDVQFVEGRFDIAQDVEKTLEVNCFAHIVREGDPGEPTTKIMFPAHEPSLLEIKMLWYEIMRNLPDTHKDTPK